MANDFEQRIKGLEDRETILYQFIDKLRQDHEDSIKRFEQNEWIIASLVDTQRSIIKTQDTLVETQGMIIKLIDRIDQKLDDFGKPGKNGHE
jgi:hypothetical protein